jgi:tungstate transport system substrate-binding protein
MLQRRFVVWAGLTSPLWPASGHAQQRQSLADPLRLGVDVALAESGLAGALQRGFGRDTGIAVQTVPGAATALLAALERGEIDALLGNLPDAEARLEKQGLLHDRRAVAVSELVLVGPAPKGRTPDPAAVAGGRDIALALQRIHAAAVGGASLGAAGTPGAAGGAGTPGASGAAGLPIAASAAGPIAFVSAGDGSGTHLVEQALWRAAGLAPASPWYVAAAGGQGVPATARARGAYALVERGHWAQRGGAPLAVLVEGDPSARLPVHVMRSFRTNHPAGKIFTAWITGPKGRRIVGAQPGYRLPAAK